VCVFACVCVCVCLCVFVCVRVWIGRLNQAPIMTKGGQKYDRSKVNEAAHQL